MQEKRNHKEDSQSLGGSTQQSIYSHSNVSFCDEYNPFADEEQESVTPITNGDISSTQQMNMQLEHKTTELTDQEPNLIPQMGNNTKSEQDSVDIPALQVNNDQSQEYCTQFNLQATIDEMQPDFWSDEAELVNEFEKMNISEKHVTFSEDIETVLVDKSSKRIKEKVEEINNIMEVDELIMDHSIKDTMFDIQPIKSQINTNQPINNYSDNKELTPLVNQPIKSQINTNQPINNYSDNKELTPLVSQPIKSQINTNQPQLNNYEVLTGQVKKNISELNEIFNIKQPSLINSEQSQTYKPSENINERFKKEETYKSRKYTQPAVSSNTNQFYTSQANVTPLKNNLDSKSKLNTNQLNIIPTKSNAKEDLGFNFLKSPKIFNLNNLILVGHPFTHTRVDTISNEKKEIICTKFIFFKIKSNFLPNLETAYESIDPLILKIVNLEEKSIDNISGILANQKINFINQIIPDKFDLLEFNTILKTFFLNEEVAVTMALEKQFYSLAFLLAPNNLKVRKSFLNYFEEDKRIFFDNSFDLINWKNNFELILRKNDPVILNTLLNQLNQPEILFILLAFHYAHNLPIDCKYFYNNFYFLSLFIKCNFSFINQDILLFRYLKVCKEFGKENFKYKKLLSKELIGKFEEKGTWFSGFKKVFDKGLFRIAGVDEIVSKDVFEDEGSINTTELINNELEDNLEIEKKKNEAQKSALKELKTSNLKEEPKKTFYQSNVSSKTVNNFFDDPSDSSYKSKEEPQKTFYQSNVSSKTVNNFFDDPPDSIYKSKESAKSTAQLPKEEKQSFFSKFNIFKKKEKSHKIDLKGDDDFKYDPIAKKWVSSIPTKVDKPIPKQEDVKIPMPKGSIKKGEFKFNDSLESRYAVKKQETEDIKDLIPKPKK